MVAHPDESGGSLVLPTSRDSLPDSKGSEENLFMFYVYIIESETTGKWYYGFTDRSPSIRLNEHNGNHHHFTANKGPWKLIFLRSFENKKDALRFEKKLKSLRSKRFIETEFAAYFLSR
jgi:putative endonuclease